MQGGGVARACGPSRHMAHRAACAAGAQRGSWDPCRAAEQHLAVLAAYCNSAPQITARGSPCGKAHAGAGTGQGQEVDRLCTMGRTHAWHSCQAGHSVAGGGRRLSPHAGRPGRGNRTAMRMGAPCGRGACGMKWHSRRQRPSSVLRACPSNMRPQHRRADHMQVSAGRVTPVLLNGLQAGGGRRGRTPHELQMTAVPEHVPVGVLALKETWRGAGRGREQAGWTLAQALDGDRCGAGKRSLVSTGGHRPAHTQLQVLPQSHALWAGPT